MEKLDFLDLHFHIAPDLYVRRHDVLSLGPLLQRLNGGVYAKSHLGSTIEVASLAQKMGYPIFGSLVLNRCLGPLNYRTVLSALARRDPEETMPLLVFLPTLKAHANPSRLKRNYRHEFIHELDLDSEMLLSEGKVRDEVRDLFKLGRDYPVRFASGHAHREEIFPLVETAQKENLSGFLLTHPTQPCVGLNHQDLLDLSRLEFIYFEQTALTRRLRYQSDAAFTRILHELPRVILASDFGQPNCPDIDEWIQQTKFELQSLQLHSADQKKLLLENALHFLSRSP